MALPAARKGDPEISHCSPMVREGCAETVFVNGRGWSRLGDKNTEHLLPCGVACCYHTFAIVKASKTVFVEGVPAGRKGDPTCTAVAEGSENVLCG